VTEQSEQVRNDNKPAPSSGETVVKPSFKPHPALLVVAIVIMIGSIAAAVAAARKDGLESRAIGEVVGGAFGAILWPFLVGWGAFLGFRRSNRAGNIAIAIMLGLSLLSVGQGAFRRQRQNTLMQEAKSISAQSQEAAAKGELDKAAALAQQAAGKLEESAKAVPENERVAAEYGASIGKQMAALMGVYLKSLDGFSKAGGESCDGLSDDASFETRLGLLDTSVKNQAKVLEYLNSLGEEMPKALAAKGVPSEQAQAFIRAYRKGGKIEKVIRYQEIEGLVLNIMGERLKILRNNIGQWSCEEGAVTVSKDFPKEDLKRYNDLQEKMAELGEEQAVVTAEVQKKK